MAWKMGRDSHYKCIFFFKDGNARTFHSNDWSYSHAKVKDPQLGLKRLRKLVSRWESKTKIAIIYDLFTGQEIERYTGGLRTDKK